MRPFADVRKAMPPRLLLPFSLLASLTLSSVLAAQIPADLELSSLGISLSSPLALRHADDGSGRVFIAERDGRVRIYHPDTGLLADPFLDIFTAVDIFFEGGLLGLAFHPDYAQNGFFYVSYTRTGTGGNPLETVVDRYSVSAGDPDDANEGSRVEIFTLDQPAGNHNGGDLHFGLDGFLYLGLGDGGSSSGTSQNNSNLLGAMLRIDPCDTPSCPQPYVVPPTNPFVGVPGLDEIWSSGLRNPYRFSFDRETGDMLIADVGEQSREEVSFQAASSAGGENYGWNCREGNIPGPGQCSGTFVEPVMTYDHDDGDCSIIGGYRYRGCIEGLRSTYVFADLCTAKIFFGTEDSPGNWSFSEWTDLSDSVLGFGEDEAGELYVLLSGSAHRFESASDCLAAILFADGFESGDTAAWSATSP